MDVRLVVARGVAFGHVGRQPENLGALGAARHLIDRGLVVEAEGPGRGQREMEPLLAVAQGLHAGEARFPRFLGRFLAAGEGGAGLVHGGRERDGRVVRVHGASGRCGGFAARRRLARQGLHLRLLHGNGSVAKG